MELLNRIQKYSIEREQVSAFVNGFDNYSITYGGLKEESDKISYLINKKIGNSKSPVIVFGHKSPQMIASFIGCAKSGHPYCPVDTSMPDERIRDIIDISNAELIIKLEDTDVSCINEINCLDLEKSYDKALPTPDVALKGEDVFYIIFTSGSTGKPKGVEITVACLDNYLKWMEGIIKRNGDGKIPVFLNQAPYSFDLSVMDTFTSLFMGGTVWSIDRRLQENMGLMYEHLCHSNISVWVSTPSFASMCLMNTMFNQDMMPEIKTFLFCGEMLTNKIAAEIIKRFPKARVFNTYGPTESTVAVTEIEITQEMTKFTEPLSIGYVKPGSEIYVMDENYTYPGLEDEAKGELVITGDTLAKGYLNNVFLTKEKFITIETPEGAIKGYKTGDIGWKKDNRIYYSGRKDFQVKINGFRIELGDIENNLLKIEGIRACTVLPIVKNGANKGLAAVICTDVEITDEFSYSQKIRNKLKEVIPLYMLPKKYLFLREMPMTDNGKVNRKLLELMIKEK